MDKIFLLSDHHFKHEAIRKYCTRPFELTREMNRYMIERHNSVVSSNDVTYCLGDFCFTNKWNDVEGILRQMNGTKILILGNHDHLKPFDYVEAGFISVHTSLALEEFLLIHDPAVAGVIRDMKVIHGHVHGLGLKLANNTFNVSVEMHDYTPVDFDFIKNTWGNING